MKSPISGDEIESTGRTEQVLTMSDTPWTDSQRIAQSLLLLDSFQYLLKRDLISREGTPEQQAQRLFEAPIVVVSHGTQADPILNYGNRTALNLWEMDLAAFLQTPSRYTAEPVHRDERARLLERTTRDGYVDDYSGIRISRTGRRFRIDQAIVWNLTDAEGKPAGQGATFSHWTELT